MANLWTYLPYVFGAALATPALIDTPSPIRAADSVQRADQYSGVLHCSGPQTASDRFQGCFGFASAPSLQDIRAAFPPQAIRGGLSGRVALDCVMAENGRLQSCAIASETPAGLGFGRAALTLLPDFEISIPQSAGLPASPLSVAHPQQGARLQVPMVFDYRAATTAPAEPSTKPDPVPLRRS